MPNVEDMARLTGGHTFSVKPGAIADNSTANLAAFQAQAAKIERRTDVLLIPASNDAALPAYRVAGNFLAALGMLTHTFKQMSQAKRDSGEAFSFTGYWTENWIHTGVALLTVLGGLMLDFLSSGSVSLVAAYAIGLGGNALPEVGGSRTVGGVKV